MKRFITLIALSVLMVGCAKAPTETRIGGGGVSADTTAQVMGLSINGVVIGTGKCQTIFTECAKDILEMAIPREYVGTVSAQGGDTGMFVAGKIELANGQPLNVSNGYAQISQNSQLLIKVIDSYVASQNAPALPGLFFQQSSGQVSGNNVHVTFNNPGDPAKGGAGQAIVTLDGSFTAERAVLKVSYQVIRTINGKQGYSSSELGTLYVPTCQFFRCQ